MKGMSFVDIEYHLQRHDFQVKRLNDLKKEVRKMIRSESIFLGDGQEWDCPDHASLRGRVMDIRRERVKAMIEEEQG